MKRQRNLHLWIGIITSLFILIESITGLLLNERWILGMDGEGERRIPQMVNEARADLSAGEFSSTQLGSGRTANTNQNPSTMSTGQHSQMRGEGGSSLMGMIRGLHEGRIGNLNMKWVMDLTAIGMIVLTITGISMSIRILAAQRKSRNKHGLAASEANHV